MPVRMTSPAATSDVVERADWVELTALLAKDRNTSLSDLQRVINRGGSVDAVDGTERDQEKAQTAAEDAFAEIADRVTACSGTYPFQLGRRSLQAKATARRSIYSFCLALTRFGKDAGPPGLKGEQLFEDVSEIAVAEYLGGTKNGAQTYLFGFPRRRTLNGFKPALNELCVRLGEGIGSRDRPKTRDQKDGRLDIVGWRPFSDGRPGKLIVFGQCATGDDWDTKLDELQPDKFCKKWLKDPLTHEPSRLFFVPHRVLLDVWDVTSIDAGIVFDRCRVAAHATKAPQTLRVDCQRWTDHALTKASP